MKQIVIFTPTEAEAAAFGSGFASAIGKDAGVSIVVSGVGMAETSASVAAAFSCPVYKDKETVAILAGIAGAYPCSALTVGDCVVVSSEKIADLGAVRDGGFVPLFEKEYVCQEAENITTLKTVRSLTVNCIGGPSAGTEGYSVENMEGAAFFAVCSALGIPFIEIRAVSNLTTDPRSDWRIPDALVSLRKSTLAVTGELLAREII